MQIVLQDESQTETLGACLAEVFLGKGPCPVLFQGPLGSGKTTLIRAMVRCYPGGSQAEVNSPSFNLVNIYPTTPEIIHLDLYRLGPGGDDPLIQDYMGQSDCQICVEWSEHLPRADYPDQFLTVALDYEKDARKVMIDPTGEFAAKIMTDLQKTLSCFNFVSGKAETNFLK